MISVTPHQIMILSNSSNNNMVHIPPTNSTPMPRKRCRVENEECDEIEKINAVSQISKRNASEGDEPLQQQQQQCDINKGNGESDPKKNGEAKETSTYGPEEVDLTNDCEMPKCYKENQTENCDGKQAKDSPEASTSQASERIEQCKRPPVDVEVKEGQIENEDSCIKCLKKKKNKKIKAKRDMQQKDDDYHFVISLLPYLRRVNLDRKLQTRMNMMKVVMEEMEYKDN
ncbi:uncharacterized protein LOC118756552 [Rhagoletis pomonella]|uniref:uncharacterized protein LOC118756552 n=1 Tax=Rhagoletis pomonella TaxID=28610 RepID=UPI001782F8BF|nr:uncharacterized protein LOC118756552 [Rhagoletis pomonella]